MISSKSQDLYYKEFLSVEERERLHEETITQLNNHVVNLPVRCREIFIMAKLKSMKNKDIAVQLDISVKAVEKNISKAYRIIRSKMKQLRY